MSDDRFEWDPQGQLQRWVKPQGVKGLRAGWKWHRSRAFLLLLQGCTGESSLLPRALRESPTMPTQYYCVFLHKNSGRLSPLKHTPIQGTPLSKPIPLPCHGVWLILLKPYPLEFPAWINQGLDVCLSLLCLLKQQSLQYSSLPLTTQCSLNMMLTQPQSPVPTRTLSRVEAWDPSPSLSNSKIILLLTGGR